MIISIITVNLNNRVGLEATLKSVTAQTYSYIDFLVIDGDSNDGSKDVLNQYQNRLAYSVSEPDSGIYNAMNKGIAMSKGEYLLFLNSGDILANEQVIKKIASQLNGIDIVSGDIIIEENGRPLEVSSRDEISLDFFFNISLYHQATFIKRQLFPDLGFYDESFRIGGDYEFFIRAFFKNNCSYKHIKETVSVFKTDGISNNSNYLDINKAETKRAWLLNVSPRTYVEFGRYYELLQSDEQYLKLRSPLFRMATKFSKLMFSIRFFFYKTFKEKNK